MTSETMKKGMGLQNLVGGRSWRGGILFGSMAVLGAAQAQQATTAAGVAAEELQEVTVTGSRVIANGNDSPTPVTVLSMDQLLQTNPGNVTAAMAMMPSIVGTPTQGGQSATNFQAVLNLRGMGGARNLVLFDGHRVQSTTLLGGIQTGVDSNLIPTMLLKRVDVVTGGASAVYGSDAVSGVINYIVDSNFDGIKVNLQGSESTYHDDKAVTLGIAAGAGLFGGRGHIEASYQRIHDPGVPDRQSRPWGRNVWTMQGSTPGSTATAGTATNPYNLIINSRFSTTNNNGVINAITGNTCANPASNPACGLLGQQFTGSGTLTPFIHGAATGSAATESGGSGGYYTAYPAFGEQKQDLGFARFDFDLTAKVKFYAEIAASTVLNHNPLFNAELKTRAIGFNNAYLSTLQQPYLGQVAAARALQPTGSFTYSRLFTVDQMPAPVNDARGRQNLYLAGLDGAWGQYKWSLGFEHADSSLTDTDPYNISNARLYAAMNAVVNPANGQVVCNASLTNAAYANCVPLNVFGQVSPAAYDYIHQYTAYRAAYHMNDVTASISGAPVNDWAGPVNMALSGEWRRQSYEVDTTSQTSDAVNCTGVQFNCVGTTPYGYAVQNYFPKSFVTVSEFAYEAEVPLLKDRFLAKSAAFNAAARYTNYSNSGVAWTWKAGLTWAFNDALSLRATRSRDIRAPNQQQLFAPSSCNSMNYQDIQSGITGTTSSCSQGNPNLTPEKADTWTGGLVWKPGFIEGLTTSLDGYHVALTNALNSISPTQPASQRACIDSGGSSPICALFVRATPTSFPSQVLSLTLNTGGIWTNGVDWEVDYSRNFGGHRFSGRLLTSYQPELTYDTGPGGRFWAAGTADSGIAGLLGNPNWKSVLNLSYEFVSDFTVSFQERYRNALAQNGSPLLLFAAGKVPPAFYSDLNFGYRLRPAGGDLSLYLNIRNLLNRQPDPFAATGANGQIGAAGGYALSDDPIGRFFTLGLNYKIR